MRCALYCLPLIVLIQFTFSVSLKIDDSDIKALLKNIVKRLDEKDATIKELKAVVSKQEQRITALEDETANQKVTQDTRVPPSDEKSEKATGVNKEAYLNSTDVLNDDQYSGATKLKRRRRAEKRRRRAENEMSVAFLASLTGHITHTGVDQNVVFDKIITNIGDAYHSALGAFIAPVSGVYVFSASLLSYGDLKNSFEFQHNGQCVVRLYHQPADGSYGTTAATITLQLVVGDDVSVASMQADKTIHGSEYTIFTGFLLEQSYDGTVVVGK